MNEILFALWFFAPAGFANMAPIIANNIPQLKRLTHPLDFGKTFRGKRIFGSHKTFRGLFAGVIVGTLVAAEQFVVARSFPEVNDYFPQVDYSDPTILVLGVALGFGALAGDAVKSFFKRQIGVQPGKSWVPFDQIDFIVGGLLFSLPFVSLRFSDYALVFVVAALLHPVANLLGWVLRLKDKPF